MGGGGAIQIPDPTSLATEGSEQWEVLGAVDGDSPPRAPTDLVRGEEAPGAAILRTQPDGSSDRPDDSFDGGRAPRAEGGGTGAMAGTRTLSLGDRRMAGLGRAETRLLTLRCATVLMIGTEGATPM